MGYSWGLYGQKLAGFDTLLPLQTHAGSGFVLEGMKKMESMKGQTRWKGV
jgi:hypothetical protein